MVEKKEGLGYSRVGQWRGSRNPSEYHCFPCLLAKISCPSGNGSELGNKLFQYLVNALL